MLKIFKQILEFAGTRKELLKKSLLFTFVGGIFAALQFVALYFVLMEVLKGNRSFMNVWPVIVVMAVSIVGELLRDISLLCSKLKQGMEWYRSGAFISVIGYAIFQWAILIKTAWAVLRLCHNDYGRY